MKHKTLAKRLKAFRDDSNAELLQAENIKLQLQLTQAQFDKETISEELKARTWEYNNACAELIVRTKQLTQAMEDVEELKRQLIELD